MALAVEAPAREDLSLRTNDDKRIGAAWMKSDGVTPVPITAAALTLQFDPEPVPDYPIVNPLIILPPDTHRIDSTTPGDPDGWIEPSVLATGVVLVTIPHGIWQAHATRTGKWDLIADGDGMRRCLVRGVFVAEEGVST